MNVLYVAFRPKLHQFLNDHPKIVIDWKAGVEQTGAAEVSNWQLAYQVKISDAYTGEVLRRVRIKDSEASDLFSRFMTEMLRWKSPEVSA